MASGQALREVALKRGRVESETQVMEGKREGGAPEKRGGRKRLDSACLSPE